MELQQQYGRGGQSVSNALQTNAVLLDKNWCDLFRSYNWLLGVSLDGPEEVNDRFRYNKEGRGTWKRVMQSVELLQANKVEFNILCVLSAANVEKRGAGRPGGDHLLPAGRGSHRRAGDGGIVTQERPHPIRRPSARRRRSVHQTVPVVVAVPYHRSQRQCQGAAAIHALGGSARRFSSWASVHAVTVVLRSVRPG